MTISAEGVLRANWRQGARRDGTRFAFTCPVPRRYTHQWTGTRASGVLDAVEKSGLREYYHPRTGAGHAEHRFGMSALVLGLPAGFSPSGPG